MLIAHPANCALPWTEFWNNQTLLEAYTFLLSITMFILQIVFRDKKNDLFFFRSIALWAIPYHPCSSSPPSVANNRATDLGSYNKCECACGSAYVCVQIFVANMCMQIFASCICSRHTCASPQSFYRCVCICVLPATLLNVMGHSPPLQLWGSSALNKWIFSIAFNLPIGWLITWSIDW